MKSKLKKSETSLVDEEDETRRAAGEAVSVVAAMSRVLKSTSVESSAAAASEVVGIALNFLNRTNSNSSCNSDSDYNSVNSAESAACSPLPLIGKASSINSSIELPCSKIVTGFYGKAKTINNEGELINLVRSAAFSGAPDSDENNDNFTTATDANLFINYGDDVGFVLDESSQQRVYLGIADGVSANRVRGYDARLFPIALLASCVKFIQQDSADSSQQELDPVKEAAQRSTSIQNDPPATSDKSNESSISSDPVHRQTQQEDENQDTPEVENESQHENSQEEEGEEEEEDFIAEDLIDESADACEYPDSLSSECRFLYNTLVKAHNLVQEQTIYGSSTVCLLSMRFLESNQDEDEFAAPSDGDDEAGIANLPVKRSSLDSMLGSSSSSSAPLNECVLSTCNLGDSGYMIIRDKQVIFKSQSQSHRFNAPFQIGCTPPELLDHDLYRDSPEDSISMTHQLKSGDFLLISSDGLFDNLYEDEIALLVDKHISQRVATARARPASASSCITPVEEADTPTTNNELDSNSPKTVIIRPTPLDITSDILSSACELLVDKASQAGIKKDDMLIMITYIV